MYAIFDKNNNRRIPSVILCSPSGEKLYSIPEAKDRQLSISLTELSEFTFEVPKLLDENGTVSPSYNLLETRRVISLEGIGQFIITKVETETDGIEEYKTVTCKGLEFEISSKNIDLLENSYSFYNPLKKEESLLDIILSYVPNWKVGTVDPDLWSVKRYFDIDVTNLYNFMMETVQEAYDCVFIFDTFNRTIGAKKRENMIIKTDISMSYNNLVKNLKLTEDAEDIVTALDVCGDGDLTISSVNPLGVSTLYDFSYYTTENWMSKGLISALNAWEKKRVTQKENFKTLKSQYNSFNEQLVVLKSQKTDLQTELASLEHRLALATVAEDSATCTEVSALIEQKKKEITNKETEITNKENQIKAKNEEIKQVSTSLSFESNFTAEQIKELSFFIYRSKIQNTNYAVLDSMTYAEKQVEMENLFAYGEKKLKDVSQPTYTCSIESINFLNLIEHKATIQEFELGAEITIEVDKKRDLFVKMVLLGYKTNLDDKTDLDLEFGNKVNFKSLNFTYEDLFNKTSSISQAFDSESNRWALGEKAYDSFNKYKGNALNLLNQEIISSENQEILINSNGIRGREWLESLKTFSGEQFWLNKNVLAFSDDGFKTTKTAFGKIFLPDGSRAYGVIADALVGNIVYTKYLTCENENGSFKVDGGSVTIKNGNILMTSDDGTDISIEDFVTNTKEEVSKDLADAILDITTNMGDMEEALKDGMVETFYQPTEPTKADGARIGDLWFNTKTGKLYRHNGSATNPWVLIEDSKIQQAVEMAQDAQTTADGKITTFYHDDFPTKDSHPTLDEGDILIHTGQGNKMYRWNGTEWVNIQDQAINAISEDLANKVTEINKNMGNIQTAIEDGMIDIFYKEGTPLPTDGKDGDLWYDISTTTFKDANGDIVTVKKNEGYLKFEGKWQPIKDKSMLEALEKANIAQDTADGKITCYYCAESELPAKEKLCEGDIWYDTANKNKPKVRRSGVWVSAQDGTIADAQKTATDALSKITSVTDKTTGEILSDKLIGTILTGKNNISCIDSTKTKHLKLNENGLLISNSKNTSGDWVWKTAISADGILAEAIKAEGTLSGLNILGGTLNIGNGSFTVSSSGDVAITKGSIKLGTDAFTVDTNGNVSITKGTIKLGTDAFTVDNLGNVSIKKGSININNGKFYVSSEGDVTAKSMTLTGASISSSTITGSSINVGDGNFTVDTNGAVTTKGSLNLGGSIKLTGSITWSTASSPVKAQYSTNGSSGWHETATSSDKYARYSYDGGVTWTSAIKIVGENGINGTDGKNGLDAKLPEFITETYIDASRVESPIFRGGLIEGCTLRARGTEKSAIEVYNASGTRAGYIKYDDRGNGNNEGTNRMFICTENGYNMKLESSSNMSLKGNNIYIEGKLILNGTEITGNGNAVFG